MKIALIQPLVSSDLAESISSVLNGLKEAIRHQADLAVLPELWNTPFINREILRHSDDGQPLLALLKKFCADHQIWLVSGTFDWKEQDHLYNRCFVISDTGKVVSHADKLHLLEVHTQKHTYRESEVFDAGDTLCTFDSPWGKAGVCICFDIRFPEVARLLCQQAKFLFVPAGFNEKAGRKHWEHLICARAIENEVFVIGVNPQAADYGAYRSYGHSLLVSPDGEILCEMDGNELCRVVEIDPKKADRIRERSPFWKLRRTDLYALQNLSATPDLKESESRLDSRL